MNSNRGEPHFDGQLLRQLKSYDDDPSVDRVWRRLAHSSVASGTGAPRTRAMRTLGSAALVCAGALMGILFERTTGGSDPSFVVSSETWTRRAPSAAVESDAQARPSNGTDREVPRAVPKQKETRQADRRRSAIAVGRIGGVAPNTVTAESERVEGMVTEPIVAVPVKMEWMLLAERGDFSGAFQQLDQSGGFDQALLSAGPDELMTLADVARAVSRQGRAIQALRIVLDQYRDNENAPLAAMMLGNLLSRAGDSTGAAEAFALNRSLSPGGDFAEDALVREFDMAITAMDLPEAERLRAQYEREYPDGRHQEALRADLDRLASELAESEQSVDFVDRSDEEQDETEPATEPTKSLSGPVAPSTERKSDEPETPAAGMPAH